MKLKTLTLLCICLLTTPLFAQTEIRPFTDHGFLRVIKVDATGYYFWSVTQKVHGGFYAITGIPIGQKFFYYVGSGATNGFSMGPGSACPLEDTMAFSVNYTHSGMRGTDGSLTFHGVVAPCDSFFHLPGGAFAMDQTWSGSQANVGLMIDSSDGTNFSKIQMGTSSDGINFSWDTLLTIPTGLGFGLTAPHLQPDPYNPSRLFGFADVIVNASTTRTTCVEVNLGTSPGTSTFRLASNAACTSWTTYSFGASVSTMPAVTNLIPSMSVQSLQKVDGAFQLFGTQTVAPSNTPPCLPGESTSLYYSNINIPLNGDDETQQVVGGVVSPNFEAADTSVLSSNTRSLPGDYIGALNTPFVVEDNNGKNLHYNASQNDFVCRLTFASGQGFKGDVVVAELDEEYFDLIFEDDFEGSNAWSSTSDPSSKIAFTSGAALTGSKGMQITFNGVNVQAAYLRDDSPTEEGRYRARFELDPNNLFFPADKRHPVLQLFTSHPSNELIAEMILRENGSSYLLNFKAKLNNGSWEKTNWITISDAPHTLEIDYERASGPSTSDGSISLWVDGVLQDTVTALTNGDHAVSYALFGAPDGIDSGTSGVLYLDHFESRRITYIGP
ncbi:MAG: hypothetical protein SX243_06540 [Acidobacteriota bacterium]|nr:hypothetical protein [Acidobacteriota bacterium]